MPGDTTKQLDSNNAQPLYSDLRKVHQVVHCSVRAGQLLGIGGVDYEQHVEAVTRVVGGGGGHGGGLAVRLAMHGQQACCPPSWPSPMAPQRQQPKCRPNR